MDQKDTVENPTIIENVTVVNEKESLMSKLKSFGSNHKKPLVIITGTVVVLGTIIVKSIFFPSDTPEIDTEEILIEESAE